MVKKDVLTKYNASWFCDRNWNCSECNTMTYTIGLSTYVPDSNIYLCKECIIKIFDSGISQFNKIKSN